MAAAVLVTDSRAARRRRRRRAGQAGPRDPAHRADPHRPGRAQSGDRARRRRRAGARRGQRLRRRAPRDPHRATRRRSPPGSATPAPSSSARSRRSASATTAPAPTTCCPPAAAPATPRGCACARSSGRCTSSTTPARRSPRSPATWSRSPRPRTCPATARPYGAPGRAEMSLPAAAGGAAGHRAVRRPAARRAGPAQRQREPVRPERGACAADIAGAVGAGRDAPSTATPTASSSSCATALAAYLDRSGGAGITPDMVWAANGSNEVMLQLLQAFGGPGRMALSFAPTYSMYPEYARDTVTEWVAGHRERGLRARPRPRPGADRGAATVGRAAAEPEQPDRHGAAARGDRGAVRGRAATGIGRASTRRTASSAGPARRARSSCCRATATWWSPAP